jgi:hypothetical protein
LSHAGTHELFTNWSETKSNMHVDLGTHAKCGVEGVGIVGFYLDSGDFLVVVDVLYVPNFRRNFLSVSTLKDKGYVFMFHYEQVFMH